MILNTFEKLFNDEIKRAITEKIEKNEDIDQEKLLSTIERLFSRESLNEFAHPIYLSLRENGPIMVEEERLIRQGFESRLQHRWLNAFYDLASVIKIAEEIAGEIIEDYMKNQAVISDNKYTVSLTFDVLMKLYSKAIVVSKEINILLKSGYSDGAISRWRSLHEYNVFFKILVSKYTDKEFTYKLIKRFADYSFVENYQELINYSRKDPNFSIDKLEVQDIKNDYQEVLRKYGNDFKKPYSWAKDLFPGKKKIYFSDLEKKAGIDHLAIYYKQANYQIHASPTGLYSNLGIIPNEKIKSYDYILGPSNYGLSIPGQLTIISLTQISTSLLLLDPNIDKMMMASIFQKYIDNAIVEFDRIQQEIEKEELDGNSFDLNDE